MSDLHTPGTDTWQVGEVTLSSRLLLGTAGYPSPECLAEAIRVSGTQIVTVGLKRTLAASGDNGFVQIVRDVIQAYLALMASGTPSTVYNVCTGVARSMRSILDALVRRSTVAVSVETDPARLRPNDVPVVVGNPARLTSATGWAPRIPFDQTLDDLLDYWQKVRTGEQALLVEKPMLVEIDRMSKPYDDLQKWCREIVWWGNKKGAYLYSPNATEITPELAGHY